MSNLLKGATNEHALVTAVMAGKAGQERVQCSDCSGTGTRTSAATSTTRERCERCDGKGHFFAVVLR